MNGSDETQVIAAGGIESCGKSEIISVGVCAPNDISPEAVSPEEDSSAVIEISDDGTWETKPASAEERNNTETGGDEKVKDENESKGSFLAPREECIVENVKIKHVTLAHSSQYYVNCPVASVKPMVHESSLPNGTGATDSLEAEMVKVKEIISNEVETKVECQSLIHVGMTNGGSVTHEEVETVEIVKEEPYADCECGVPEEHADVGGIDVASEEVRIESASKPVTLLGEEFAVNPSDDPSGGDVVTDSILQNKEKTKSYWEEMMLAAASGKESPPGRFRPSEGRVADGAEDGVCDVEVNGGGDGTTCSLGGTGPKIVETVAKRTEWRGEAAEATVRESVVEREIRQQREREEALQREREEARCLSSPESPPRTTPEEWKAPSPPVARLETPAEVKIALELREMREREEELRKLRQQLGLTATNEASEAGDAFHSIPTTDEGNFSECGVEEKDLGMEVIGSQMMSSDMPSLDITSEHNSFMHRRTQSTDSTSSGHSSGSGGPRAGPDYPPRRRIIVKPIVDPEEDGNHPQFLRRSFHKEEVEILQESQQSPNSVRNIKETPIEREIRIAREREEELRREKGLMQRPNQIAFTKPEVPARGVVSPLSHPGKGPQNVQLRLATTRIQREIQETTEREKELRDAGKIHTMSVDTLDSKAPNDAELTENTSVPHRRGWMSAEEKIQEELKQMKMREDELRLQRAHIMAQSQPNLLSIMDEAEESSQLSEEDNKMPSLYSTLSNPNLLDFDGDVPVKEVDFSQDQASQKNSRRKSALIAQWESRIQQNTDH